MNEDELGARVCADGVRFCVWAPTHELVELLLENAAPLVMTKGTDGMHRLFVPGAGAGDRYHFALDGGAAFPDPASRFQPDGVHGGSEVVDPTRFTWSDSSWRGASLRDLVIYELHVGTFSAEGTFDGVRARLRDLAELGINAIELMPVHDFPGERGWGYDPAALFAPCRAYGRPDDLRRLVDAAHAANIAVILDVVYNHLGPDGAYWAAYGPVLTDRHETAWGRALDLDGPLSRGVRGFIVANALHWLREYHVDGLRLDATFALIDDSDEHILAELARSVEPLALPRRILIAEDGRNLARIVTPRAHGGYGIDAMWSDDFHHIVRRILTGDDYGYYRDFPASTEALARCIEQGWYYTGQPSIHWGGIRGSSPDGIEKERFVFFIQNHDQIGNRPWGDRLAEAIGLSAYRAASALLLFLPEVPLLFMGQEHASLRPFRYFTDHEPELGRRVAEGRRTEFAGFAGFEGELPHPQDRQTFAACVLDEREASSSPHREMRVLYRDLLALRRRLDGEDVHASSPSEGLLLVTRARHVLAVSLGGHGRIALPSPARVILDTEDARYAGAGLPDDPLFFQGARAVVLERE